METMAADDRRTDNSVEKKYGWGKSEAVEDWLFAEGFRFDFFQAVRLLEMIRARDETERQSEQAVDGNGIRKLPPRTSPGESANPAREMVRFRSAVSLDFPASDIADVGLESSSRSRATVDCNGANAPAAMVHRFKKQAEPAQVTVNFLGLAGGLGALDIPITELILRRASQSDEALKDFLDIFNHRLVSLLYRIRKHHRVALDVAAPGEDHVSRYLYSLIGMGTSSLRGRMHFRDRALLHYAGILAQQPRSMAGLERILADYFQVEVKGQQFQGRWCDLEPDQWTRIGVDGQNQRLGRNTVVGTQVWDQAASLELHLGPLSLRQFLGFLPTKWRFGALCDLIRFYVHDRFDFNIRLTLRDTEIVGSRLRSENARKKKRGKKPYPLGLLAWTSRLEPLAIHGENWRAGNQVPRGTGEPLVPHPGGVESFSISISPKSLGPGAESIKSRVLSRLPSGKQSELLGMAASLRPCKNEVIMLQGKPGHSMFVVRKGKVQISRREEKGQEKVVAVLQAGDAFGERALLMRKPYSETALALTRCEIAEITREQLDAFAARYATLRSAIDAYCLRWHSSEKVLPGFRN